MRHQEEVNQKKRLAKKLESNGVASSQAEAERLANRMLSTSDKVQKQHDAHRRAEENTEEETEPSPNVEPDDVTLSESREDRNRSKELSDSTKEALEKQKEQEDSFNTASSSEPVTPDELPGRDGEDSDGESETSDYSRPEHQDSTTPESSDDDSETEKEDLEKKREEADESNIDLGNVFDTSK